MLLNKFWAFLTVGILGTGTVAQQMPTEEETRAFHSLVQTAGVASVEASLIENPALATAQDKYGFQAIHALDYKDFNAILVLLLSYGADINSRNDEGHSLLHILIDPEFVPLVLQAGADLELKDDQGRTPLLLALTEPDSYAMAKALLDAGANPNMRDNNGRSALNYVRANGGTPEIIELLLDAGASE